MERLRETLGVVNPLGWTVAGLGVVALAAGLVADWQELATLALGCLVLCLLALPFLAGRTRIRVQLELEPERIVAGGTVVGAVRVTNIAGGRLLPTILELPVGENAHRYPLPSLAPDAEHEEGFTIRTERRGVIPVGPVTTRRGDPAGLFSRDARWTDVREVLVRPVMVPLEALGAGLLRDLEGVTTDAISQSDLAFHALREYTPGDDLRHVHWRSSAKADQLLVRQYLDTRRSHATVVVDDRSGAWRDPDDFETALSAAASIVTRAVLDDFETSFMCGGQVASGTDGNLTLDAICRVEPGRTGLVSAANRAAAVATDTSLLFLVTGAAADFATVQRAAAAFDHEVRRIGIVLDPSRTSTVTEVGDLTVIHLAELGDLAALLRWSVQ